MNILFLISLFVHHAAAELGLTIESTNEELKGIPIRLVEGQLTVRQGGPLLQADLLAGKLVLSDKIVAKGALGAGVSMTDDGKMGISKTPAEGFAVESGWLEYNENPMFYVQNTTSGLRVYTNFSTDAIPILLQVAQIVYPSSSSNVPCQPKTTEITDSTKSETSTTPLTLTSFNFVPVYATSTAFNVSAPGKLPSHVQQIEVAEPSSRLNNTTAVPKASPTGAGMVLSEQTTLAYPNPLLTTVVKTVYAPAPTGSVFHTTRTITVTSPKIPTVTVTTTIYRVIVTVTESPRYSQSLPVLATTPSHD